MEKRTFYSVGECMSKGIYFGNHEGSTSKFSKWRFYWEGNLFEFGYRGFLEDFFM
jgi:hypothetical protein